MSAVMAVVLLVVLVFVQH